jgi:tetratricopeptide (TPR) repeat protein
VEGASGVGLFLGVGVDHYADPDLVDLPGSADEVQAIADLVGDHFGVRLLRDPDEATIVQELRGSADHFADDAGAAVLMWSGHGVPGPGSNSLRLLAHDSRNEPSEGLDAVEVATRVAATGANQILMIIDTCYAGNAAAAVNQVESHFRSNPPAGDWCWFGLLAACGPEKVRQHQLAGQLERLLKDGPSPEGPHAEDIRRRWSTHHHFIRGDDLWDALIKQWDRSATETEPRFTCTGDARPFIRNPLWSVAAGPIPVAEILTGLPTVATFFGRETELSTVGGWLKGRFAGLHVVTGAAGSGKSALLAHVLSSGAENISMAQGATDAVLLDVSGLSADVIAATVDGILVARHLLEEAPAPRNVFEICGGLQRRRDSGAGIPVIAFDSLTEAADPMHIIDSLVTPLSTVATVIVATRPTMIGVPRQRRASQPTQWAAAGETADQVPIAVALAPPERVLDLDSVLQRLSGWDAIDEMVKDAGGTEPDNDPAAVMQVIRRQSGAASAPPFVLAKLLSEGADGAAAEADLDYASIGASLGVALDDRVSQSYDQSVLGTATALLNALPFGFGAGLPEREWLTIANATRLPDTPPLDRGDVAAAMAPVGDLIVEDSESGEAVYRFAHTTIAQHFASNARAVSGGDIELAVQIAGALVAEAELTNAAGNSPRSLHLQRYLWRYVARAGEEGLDLLRGTDSLSEDLASAALGVSVDAAERGDIRAALSLAEEAVSVGEALAGFDRDQRLAPALAQLATLYQSTGQVSKAVEFGGRAVETYNQLVGDRPGLIFDLAAAGQNFANMLMDAQDTRASEVAAQVVALEQRFIDEGGDNRYRLGVASNTLALALSMEGRIEEAVDASRNAVNILRSAVESTATERDRAGLAQALQNLGSHLADHGELEEAVTVTEEARVVMDDLVAVDDRWRPALLETLSDLGVRYIQVGRSQNAFVTAGEAVAGYQTMTTLTPAEVVNYAGALTNYATILAELDRGEAAIDPARVAVDVLRDLAEREESKRPALALMLENYAIALTHSGHHTEALEASFEALSYYRAARDDNPSLDNDVARVLSNYCQRLAASGQFLQASVAGAEAIRLFDQLSAGNPRHEVHAAITRSVVAIYIAYAGNARGGAILATQATVQGEQLLARGLMSQQDLATVYIEATKATGKIPAMAVPFAQRATQLLREADLSRSPGYATAVRNLAALHGMAGQIEDGLAAIEESIAVWTRLLGVDGSHRNGLASALSTRASLQVEHRDPAAARDDAVAAIDHYRQVPELSADDLETCGITLGTLGRALSQLNDDLEPLDQYVAHCLENRDGPTRAQLLCNAVAILPAEHPRAPLWIHMAIHDLGTSNPMLLLQIRWRARKIRETVGHTTFDQLWTASTGTDLPDWVEIDQQKIDWAMRWISSADFTAAEDFLRQNDNLLGEDYNTAVDEALHVVNPARAAALKDIRARLKGSSERSPEEANGGQARGASYDLAERFLGADLNQRSRLLAEYGEDLRGETVGQHLRAHDKDPRMGPAVSLIELSRIPLHIDVVEAAPDAEQVGALLARIAENHDIKTLRQAAVVLMTNASDVQNAEVMITSSFYVGVTMLSTDFSMQGIELIRNAAEFDMARVQAWIRLCDNLSASSTEFAQAAGLLDNQAEGGGG